MRGDEGGIDARRAALSEVGRALALDPADARALGLLQRLLTHPPQRVPDEIEAQVQANLVARERLGLGSADVCQRHAVPDSDHPVHGRPSRG